MGPGILTKYSASAGSGKTYKLTTIYLSKLFSSVNAHRKILAVTFTNKAASTMKRRILDSLHNISSGTETGISAEITASSQLSEQELRSLAPRILYNILHDFSYFNVGTIDSFFQKILRVFTREIGLKHGYTIELDHTLFLKKAVEKTLEDTAGDIDLRNWIEDYSRTRIEEGKNWNLREDITKLAEEIFNEKFRLLADEGRRELTNRQSLKEYLSNLRSLRSGFEKDLASRASRCREILDSHKVADNMFLRGTSGGVGTFLNMMASGTDDFFKPLNITMSSVLDSPPVWTSKAGPSPALVSALDDGFAETFIDALKYYQANYLKVNTAILVSQNIYILGILADILDNVRIAASDMNKFLLSDTGELLWLIIRNDQTPFIYEKAGNIFENFMIDEFQDTSTIQWENFRPLIENSMSEGHDNLVVGDVKQSIYRWRNSDWNILSHIINRQFDESRLYTERLEKNWRSRKNIISFNNSLFSILPELIDKSEKNNTGSLLIGELYSDAPQYCPGGKEGGYVKIEFLEDDKRKFEEMALEKLPGLIENLQDNGYPASDIGILVRSNSEGADVLQAVLEYSSLAAPEKRGRYNYNIVSNDSLLVSSSPAVRFLISLLRYTINPDDDLSRAVMLLSWLAATGRDQGEADISDLENESARLFPSGYSAIVEKIRNQPLFESIETAILFFGLGRKSENTAFLSSFQDMVLQFSAGNSPDTSLFLDWWDSTGSGKSIVLSDIQDSIRVMTIHKAKGLEFRAVIIPFISWNMGHGHKPPIMWIAPENEPFNSARIVPVKYKSAMQHSEFANEYFTESYYALVDNLNLLYVAFTRAIDCLAGFCPANPGSGSVAVMIRQALSLHTVPDPDKPSLDLAQAFSESKNTLEIGEIERKDNLVKEEKNGFDTYEYPVNQGINNLHLKFSAGKWLAGEAGRKLNYGRIMHEIFESVYTVADITPAVEKLVLEGKILHAESNEIIQGMTDLVSGTDVRDWFKTGLCVLNESSILSPDGTTKRPDRTIIDGDEATIIDFKFGSVEHEHIRQINTYSNLLKEMGYRSVRSYLWYVEMNKVVKV